MYWRCREREREEDGDESDDDVLMLCNRAVNKTTNDSLSLQNVRFKGDPKIRGGGFVVFTMH